MKKRLLSLILVFAMVFGMMPTMALAGDQMEDTVYISVSFDGQYVNDKTGEPMAYIPVSLSELQAIDLEEYGLTEYEYNGQLTALHLYIYTHEKIMGNDWNDVGVSGGAGSIFFENGLFGFQDCNLQYYCNGEYPEVDGWGVTADQLVLNDGDFFDIAAYTSWAFYSDSAFGFHYFLDNEEIAHEYTATAGEPLMVTLGRGASYMGGEYSMTKVSGYTVSYGTAFGTATGTVTTNTAGQAEITFAEAGTYYLWVNGDYGAENPLDIVSAPGCAKVTVEAAAPSYPFALSVGGEELTITDLGTTECTTNNKQVKAVSVTVPAGTAAVTLKSVNGMLSASVNHDAMVYVYENSSEEVSVSADTCLCTLAMADFTLYHINIEFAPCTHETWNPATCATPKTCAACGETEGEADPEAHSYVDGKCEYCEQAEPVSYPFTLTVGGETLTLTDLGTTVECTKMYYTAKQMKVTVPAGTTTVVVNGVSGAVTIFPNHGSQKNASPGSNTEVSVATGTYLCMRDIIGGGWYHVAIEFAPCTHETWNPATCTTPKTCSVCGATEGEANTEAHSYVDGKCEYCGEDKPISAYTVKLSETETLQSNLNHFASIPADGMDIIFDFGSGTISGTMCQTHCGNRNIHVAGEGSTLVMTADVVEAHLFSETQRNKFANTFGVYLTEGSKMFEFYYWTTSDPSGSYLYLEILPSEEDGGDIPEGTCRVTLPTNTVGYSIIATSSPTVEPGGSFSFKLNIYDDYKKGENFKVLANGVELTSSGDTYTITNITANQTVTVEGVVEKTLAEKNVTVNAPAGSVVSSGAFHSYFKYDFVEPLQISTLEDGRVQYIVPATSGAGGFIRVQNPDGVTYWDFGDLAIGKVFNITDEMLFIGNTEYTKDTVFANYEKNGHDTASLYLTVNAQGWLDMDTGDTHSLNVFRNWIPVSNSTTNTGVSLPDVTYTVVDVNGNASDVVTVTPDANNSCYADIKAEKAGTAIILVTYDAVYNADGEGGKQFSAIWPENTGVIVVTVDAEDADIQTNITVNETANAGGKQILDVEHDILFYVGNAGAEYSFKPEDGCTVTISRSTVGNEMTFNGFTNEGVTVSEDGTVTLSGLTTGAHIVKVEKDGKAAYQVIRAREVSYKLTHSDGTEVTAENPAQPGETITVQFSKLIDPMGKLSGVYNAKYGFRYTGENGDVITITSTSAYGEYYFGSNPARQRFNVTVPTEWSSVTYTFTDGSLKLEGWGSTFGGHRSTTYMEGKEPNTNASGTAGYAAVLPDVVIPVDVEPEVDTTLSTYIFNSDIDGTGWGRADAAYADKLSLFGVGVDALRWDGDTCYVTLDKKTESNAGLGFLITYKAQMDSWLDGLKATVNGESMTANEMLFTKLTNGTLTAEVYVTNNDIPSQSGTKTFVITVADETACDHEWTEANCTVPKTCKLCSVTRGDVAADGHNYVNGRCEYCGNYVGIEIVTGDTASSNQDIRISDFHINASGSVTSNTISEDGRATIQIKAPFDELELTISMFGKSGNAVAKAALSINDGAEVEPTSVDKDNNVAVWVGTVTPEWNGNKAEIKVTVGFLFGSNVRNPKEYILTLEKVEETPTPETYTVTLPTGTGYTVAATEGSTSPVAEGGSYSFTVTVVEDYDGTNMVVKANDVVLTAVEGIYTIENITADQTITVEGVEVIPTYTVTLPTETTGYTVTATEGSTSPVTEGGNYSFTVTIAEGYEAGEDFAVKANDVELTAVEGIYTIENITADQTITVEGVVEKQEEPALTWQEVMAMTQTYLAAQAEETAPVVGTFKGDWVVLGLARNGITADFMDAYYENVKTYVAQNIDLDGRLHAQKSTDNSRVILGLTAIDKDVTDVAGYNLLKGLSNLNYVKTQGINGPVFALIALDSKDYPTADNATATREALVEYILSKQLTDGGWALDGRNIDDMTPMAIQALAPYYNTNDDVKAAVDKALMVMKTMSATPETYAQMIVALSALGIDCETDERFANVMDNMLSFALENGSFEKGKGSGTNQMSTEQCFYAMVAYNRFKNGQTALYDMSDLKDLHTVEILPYENGSVTVSKSSAMTGETITVTIAPDLGYQISKLTMNDTELTVTDNRATFIMPDETAILEATFVKAEASAQAVAQAMSDLEVKDADEETYNTIADIKKAYSKLTAAEKLEIADEYRAFQSKVKQFEAYLKAHIDDAVDELEYFFDDLDEEDYSKQVWKKIEDLYEEALEAVKAARFEEEVYELLDAYLEDLEEAAAGELEVTFRLIGDWKHDDGVSGHDEYVTWIETTEYNMPAGSTIYDLFIKAIDDFDLNEKGASKNYVESIQAPDILGGYWIGEFDNGPNSGWMYTINGYHPGYGLKEQDLEDGDEVIWHYVDDYTLEERKPSSKYYERWLEADDISPETYVKRHLDKIVTVEGKGEVKPELKMSHIGKDVKFSFTPAEGWVIKNVYVDGKDKGAIETYTYKDLAMDARIEVVFAQNVAFQMNFVDVPEAEWFYDDVYFAVSNGLFNGIDEFTFAPGASMTRAMLVTVLYRLEGQPAVTGGSAFADAAAGQWYTDAVIWATRNGIVNGYDNGKFGTDDNVTREQMATILYRYAQNCGYDTTARADLNGYTDAAKISSYAQEAMSWANAMGLINGRTAASLAPTGTATRAEVAAIFHRFVENIVR